MLYQDRRRIRRQLETELQTSASRCQPSNLGVEFPVLRGFKSWQDVIGFLLDPSTPKGVKDAVLQALVVSFQRGVIPECGAVLLLAFWPALTVIARRRAAWNDEDDELWHTLEWAFLESAQQLDVTRDPCNIAKRLVRTTGNRLRKSCRREVSYKERKTSLPDPGTSGGGPEDSVASIEPGDDSRAAFVLAKQRVVRAYRTGLLSSEDLRLLIEIDYEGNSIEEAALRRGLSYGALKKRRQRMLTRLRSQFQENRGRASESLSPKRRDRGLSR